MRTHEIIENIKLISDILIKPKIAYNNSALFSIVKYKILVLNIENKKSLECINTIMYTLSINN